MDPQHQNVYLRINIVNAVTAVGARLFGRGDDPGVFAGLIYWVLGVPYAVVWGVVTAFSRFSRRRIHTCHGTRSDLPFCRATSSEVFY